MKNKISNLFHILVQILEYLIATLTIVVLLFLLGLEIYKMFTLSGYFDSTGTYLQNILTIIIGLEFVRMLINLTPANLLEVLIVAISRQIIINHDNPLVNISCVLCIAGLFAIRRFLISEKDLKHELSGDDIEDDISADIIEAEKMY
ncbi:MAG: hypothetical protein IJC89_01615 [Clostridia bacterium]|nr:hypothetical protein [Clostridia bacterium]